MKKIRRLIYQVSVGKPSKLYEHCIQSVAEYCKKYDIEHIVLTKPKLRIAPDIFTDYRSKESYEKYGGYLPIYEKENAFDLIDKYDQIGIIDADIYIRPDSPNIFTEFGHDNVWGSVSEREMDINEALHKKDTKLFSYAVCFVYITEEVTLNLTIEVMSSSIWV